MPDVELRSNVGPTLTGLSPMFGYGLTANFYSTERAHPDAARYHSLDALRGVMMLLGIYLHAAVAYSAYGNWPWKDGSTTGLFDVSLGLIHVFRMPVFYVLRVSSPPSFTSDAEPEASCETESSVFSFPSRWGGQGKNAEERIR